MEPHGLEPIVEKMLTAAAEGGLRLRRGDVRLDESGWDFVVLHVTAEDGTAWILRRPRRTDMLGRIRTEAVVLDTVRGALPVAVPEWRCRDPELVAYPRLPGVPAAVEDPATLQYRWRFDAMARKVRYLAPLGRCLATLHAVPMGAAVAAGLPVERPADARSAIAVKLARAEHEVGVPDAWRSLWWRWLADDESWATEVALRHGDVHPGHTLVSPDGGLTGLLDWTNASGGDPSLDFVDLTYAGGRRVLDTLLACYVKYGGSVGPATRRHILARTAFVLVTVALNGLDRNRPWYLDIARGAMAQPPDDDLLVGFCRPRPTLLPGWPRAGR